MNIILIILAMILFISIYGATNYYIVLRTWGPPVRVGSRSEIVEINITFK